MTLVATSSARTPVYAQLSMDSLLNTASTQPSVPVAMSHATSFRIKKTQGNITYLVRKPKHPDKNKGMKTEVYAFKSENDLVNMQKYFLYDCSKRVKLRLRNWLFFSLGINMGFRVSDLCKLQWRNIFLPQSSEFNLTDWNELIEQKTGKKRQIVLNTAAQKAITYYVKQLQINPEILDPNSYVFWSNKKSEPHVQPDSMYEWIKQAARELNIPFNVGTHSMRKTFGYMLYRSTGKDIAMVQRILNHSSEQTTLRYIGIDQENVRQAYNTVPDMVWTPE